MPADDELRTSLARDGVVVVPGVLDDGWCGRLRGAVERCRATPGPHYGVLSPAGCARVDSDLFRWGDDDDLWAVTHDSPLVALAARLLDEPAVVLVEDQWFASEPGATTSSPWHQDQPYYRLDRPFLTIWVTLDDIGHDGSLRVVEGSHDGPTYATVEFSASSTTVDRRGNLPPVPDVDGRPGCFAVRSWSLRAGDAIALDSRALHATGRGALATDFRRLSTRWAAPDTRYATPDHGTAAFWDLIPHGLGDGDLLASASFPLVVAPHGASSQGRNRQDPTWS